MTLTKACSLILALGCLLNMNGVGLLLIGINQLYSPFLLLSSILLILIAYRENIAISPELILYVLSIVAYLVIGSTVGIFSTDMLFNVSLMQDLLIKYTTSILIVVAAYMSVRMTIMKQNENLRNVLILCFIASLFIPFGEYINTSGKLFVGTNRGAGLFGNPNEAGIIAVVGFTATLTLINSLWLRFSLLVFFLIMVIFTFSKAVFIMLLAVFFTDFFIKGNLSKGFVKFIIVLTLTFLTLLIFKEDIVGLFENYQARRMRQILDLILFSTSSEGGGIEESRGFLWKIGLDKILENPLFGNGLGALHSMQGTNISVNNKVLQGVHNTYLVRLGDSGIIPLILFILFMSLTFNNSRKFARKIPEAKFCMFYIIIFSLSCMVTHGAESLRFHNYLIGISLGFLQNSKSQRLS
jgi:O-antigen ligase